MKKLILCSALTAFGVLSHPSYAASDAKIISQEEAIKSALGALDVEVLGIRMMNQIHNGMSSLKR